MNQLALETVYKTLQYITGDLTLLVMKQGSVVNDPEINAEFDKLLVQAGVTLAAIEQKIVTVKS